MTEPILQLSGVRKSFGNVDIIRGVNLAVTPGEKHAVIGPNGAGKSTLFHLISGLLPLSQGQIELMGENITGLAPQQIARKGLSRSFQITNIFSSLTVWENVQCALLWAMGYRYSFLCLTHNLKKVQARTLEILEEVSLVEHRQSKAGVLAYADQRSLEIGLAIASGAQVILLDEPMAGMNTFESERALRLLQRLSANRTLLMIEHDMDIVFTFADRVSVLVYGEIVASGTPAEIQANARVQEAYLGKETH